MNKWRSENSTCCGVPAAKGMRLREQTTGRTDWAYILISLKSQPKNFGIYFNGDSLRVPKHNCGKVRPRFPKDQSGGDLQWTWKWCLFSPLRKQLSRSQSMESSWTWYRYSLLLLQRWSVIRPGQCKHFISLGHSHWFRETHLIEAKPMRLSPRSLDGGVGKDMLFPLALVLLIRC